MAGSDVAVRERSFDLTRAPNEQWNDEMLQVVARNVFRGMEVTQSQLYFCLSVAEGLGLNPMIGEIYFIPGKSSDGKGPAFQPYIGRNGLVKKAAEKGYYFEADTVRAGDKFRIIRKAGGERTCTHSYGVNDRGAVMGAYAFLHRKGGGELPSFFYAPLADYMPTFDADWKLAKSMWGNQLSAAIEKCAMIGAGRKRLDLGNVLIDGEVEIVQQMRAIGAGSLPAAAEAAAAVFDWGALADVDADAAATLRDAVQRARAVEASAWPPAKLEMVTQGMTGAELRALAGRIDAEYPGPAPDGEPEPEVLDGEVVRAPESSPARDPGVEPDERTVGLQRRLTRLEDALNDPHVPEDQVGMLHEEIEAVQRELGGAQDPGQGSLI